MPRHDGRIHFLDLRGYTYGPMTRFRLRRRISQVLVAVHLSLAAASLALVLPVTSPPVQCTCAHSGEQQCPMHHPASAEQQRTCRVRSGASSRMEALVSLLGALVLPEPVFHPAGLSRASSVTLGQSRLVDAVSVPLSPPPRA